jgi:hypothetical protein
MAANRIVRNVEVPAKFHGFQPVQDLGERPFVNVPDRAMEKTRPDRAIGFEDGGNPRGITPRRPRWYLPELHTEMKCDTPELRRAFHNESRFNILSALMNESLDLDIEQVCFDRIQSNRRLARGRPAIRSIKGSRNRVGSKKRKRVQVKLVCRPDRIAKFATILFLDRASARHTYARPKIPELLDSLVQTPICTGNPANPVMDFRGPIDRDDNVIHALDNHFSVFLELQACCQKC